MPKFELSAESQKALKGEHQRQNQRYLKHTRAQAANEDDATSSQSLPSTFSTDKFLEGLKKRESVITPPPRAVIAICVGFDQEFSPEELEALLADLKFLGYKPDVHVEERDAQSLVKWQNANKEVLIKFGLQEINIASMRENQVWKELEIKLTALLSKNKYKYILDHLVADADSFQRRENHFKAKSLEDVKKHIFALAVDQLYWMRDLNTPTNSTAFTAYMNMNSTSKFITSIKGLAEHCGRDKSSLVNIHFAFEPKLEPAESSATTNPIAIPGASHHRRKGSDSTRSPRDNNAPSSARDSFSSTSSSSGSGSLSQPGSPERRVQKIAENLTIGAAANLLSGGNSNIGTTVDFIMSMSKKMVAELGEAPRVVPATTGTTPPKSPKLPPSPPTTTTSTSKMVAGLVSQRSSVQLDAVVPASSEAPIMAVASSSAADKMVSTPPVDVAIVATAPTAKIHSVVPSNATNIDKPASLLSTQTIMHSMKNGGGVARPNSAPSPILPELVAGNIHSGLSLSKSQSSIALSWRAGSGSPTNFDRVSPAPSVQKIRCG